MGRSMMQEVTAILIIFLVAIYVGYGFMSAADRTQEIRETLR